MVQFYEAFSTKEIVATLSQQLTWSHIKELISLEDNLEREFYATMCNAERWSVRTLRERIGSMMYEITVISKKTEHKGQVELYMGMVDVNRNNLV
jgi:predicted nuclease of restriction endonuclease-like (RecB) superfamily